MGRVNMIAYPILLLVIVVAPLTIVAAFAYRVPAVTFQQVAVRVWPIAALGEYVLIWIGRVGTFPSHALQGFGIPLAVLAVVEHDAHPLFAEPNCAVVRWRGPRSLVGHTVTDESSSTKRVGLESHHSLDARSRTTSRHLKTRH